MKKDKKSSLLLTGELVEKNASHLETILSIDYLDEQIIMVIPHDLDDFVKVGEHLEITIKKLT